MKKAIQYTLYIFFCQLFSALVWANNNFDDQYFLIGDKIDIAVFNSYMEPEFDPASFSITRQDKVFVPRLGEIFIQNKTIRDFKEEVQKRMSKTLFLKNPKIQIDITKSILTSILIKKKFIGQFKVPYNTTIGELFVQIKPLDVENINFNSVNINRNGMTISLNSKTDKRFYNFHLQHKDHISIGLNEDQGNRHYYLVGNFQNVGRFFISKPTTLMDVLAGHNLTNERYTRKFYVFRKSQGTTIAIDVDARSLMKMGDLTQNIEIKGGDVILASVERKMHLIQKFKDILTSYTDLDTLVQQTEAMKIFK